MSIRAPSRDAENPRPAGINGNSDFFRALVPPLYPSRESTAQSYRGEFIRPPDLSLVPSSLTASPRFGDSQREGRERL